MNNSTKAKGGRPEAPISWAKVTEMLKAQCSGEGIAEALGISADTLYRRCKKEQGATFTEFATAKKAEGKNLLRMKQFELALSGDRTMLIFLGKAVLGQKEIGAEPGPDNWQVTPISFRPQTKEKEMTDEELDREIDRLERTRKAIM